MLIINSKNRSNNSIPNNLNISEAYLQKIINNVAIPRHYIHEYKNNIKVRDWIKNEFNTLGLNTTYQGKYDNIVATYDEVTINECSIVIGGHYDSVPNSFGADDNGSAIAGLLAVAKALRSFTKLPIMFVAFNREEDGLLGSYEFVNFLPPKLKQQIKAVHILEMIGYCSHKKGSQSIPQGLPIKVSDIGDFIAIIANKKSNHFLKPIIKIAEKQTPNLPVKALKVYLGLEKYFPHLSRSDHAPFWEKSIPAMMWTDTSEFRNPNYHQKSDTPDTLDYEFMKKVIELLCLVVLDEVGETKVG